MLLVDTNVLLAAADTSAAEHSQCSTLLDRETAIAITAPVATESAWMLQNHRDFTVVRPAHCVAFELVP